MLEFLLVQSSGPGQTSPCIFLCAMIFRPETTMQKRRLPGARGIALSIALATGLAALPVFAQDKPFKIGLILPMTGQQATTGRQKVQLLVRDDTSLPDMTRRLAQELVVNDKVNVLAGMGITPSALATVPLATQSKTPLVVMSAATSSITEASPYVVRTSFTLPQVSVPLADWASGN